MAAPLYRLNPTLDGDRLAEEFRKRRRLHIPDFLNHEGAEQLLAALMASNDWRLIVNQSSKVTEFDRTMQAAMPAQQRAQIVADVFSGAQRGFQYWYETIKSPHADTDRLANANALNEFARFMSSTEVVDFFRAVTGARDITFADAQATAYGPRHFLTSHDDLSEEQKRRVAYVFNLSKGWRVDWGGLLAFHDGGAKVIEAMVPAFNALNLFAVPQSHSVTFVAPFAPQKRYSVTGWLRAGTPP